MFDAYTTLSDLYVFCEKTQDITAKHATIAAFVELSEMEDEKENTFMIDDLHIRKIFAGTLPHGPSRMLAVDHYVLHNRYAWPFGFDYNDWPHEFLNDVMNGMLKNRKMPKSGSRTGQASYYQDKLMELETAADEYSDHDTDANTDSSDSDSGSSTDSG